jgi:hypothetical protein
MRDYISAGDRRGRKVLPEMAANNSIRLVEGMWQRDVDSTMKKVKKNLRDLREQVEPNGWLPGQRVMLPERCLLLLGQLEVETLSWLHEQPKDQEPTTLSPLRRIKRYFSGLSSMSGYARLPDDSGSSKQVSFGLIETLNRNHNVIFDVWL